MFSPQLPSFLTGVGYNTRFGPVVMEPGSRVAAYVRSTGAVSDEDPVVATNLVQTLAAGLARCRSGKNDVVFVLPGHVETVTATTLTGLVAGTRVIGCGRGSSRPTFTWGATTSQFVMNKADVVFLNCIFNCNGAVVVKAFAVTAADNAIIGCDIDVGSVAATNLSTIGVSIEAGADRFLLSQNYIHSVALATPTTVVAVSGVQDGASILDNKIYAATSVATVGVVHVSAAATNLEISRNLFWNKLAAGTACFSATGVASTGVLANNFGRCETDTTQAAVFSLTANCLLSPFQNFATDKPILSGLLSPVVVT